MRCGLKPPSFAEKLRFNVKRALGNPKCPMCGVTLFEFNWGPLFGLPITEEFKWYKGEPICASCAAKVESKQITQPVTPAPPQFAKEVYREREIVREIVKVRCQHCGDLFEERLNRCPYCGAPL